MPKDIQERTALEEAIAVIQARYEPKIQALKTKAEETASGLPSKEEIMFNVDIDEWEEVEWIFDIPEVTWDLTTIKMHIPEVTMRMKRTRGSGGAEPPLEPPSRGARPDPDQRLRKTHAKRATSRLASLEPDAVQGVYSTQP
jgi:hypothetical protein